MTDHGPNEQGKPPDRYRAAAVYRQFPALQPSQLPGSLTHAPRVVPVAAA